MNYVVHRRDIEPACGDVRREQYSAFVRLEAVEVFEALSLLELGV